MTQILVRRAEPADAAGIALVFRARNAAAGTLQNPYPSVAHHQERLNNTAAKQYIFVAVAEDMIVGHAGLHQVHEGNPRRAHVWGIGMAVRDDWQRRGVGTRLMQALLDLADNWLGALRVELTVYADNEAALALYRKFGFAMEGTHRAFALREGVYVDAHAMARLHPHPPQLPSL